MHRATSGKSMAKKQQGTFLSSCKSTTAYFCLLYLAANVFSGVSSQTEGLTLTISQGEVKGTFEAYQNKDGDPVKYSLFRGIPYAKPPVGPLRFKDPEKPENWTSLFEANKFGSVCPQWDSEGKMVGEEHCLFINVYTPISRVPTISSYPVMVFIHGGYFQKGSSNPYEQKKWIQNDIILVTFNYRLGILGFLSTGDEACPGNLGLKDQVLALQWIKDNIRYFGGNPNSITLFGQGAGAVSVFLHILSPKSQGLLHQAITQSGSPFCDWTIEEKPLSYTVEVAQRLHCSTKSSSTMIDCIRNKPLQDVLQAQKDNKTFGDYPLRAIPVIERGGFLPDLPAKLMDAGAFKPIPLISGVNKDDGAVLYPLIKSYEDALKTNSSLLFNQLIPKFLLTATDIRGNIESVSQAVYFQYFNGIDPTNVTQVLQPFVNVSTDAMFVSCNYKTLQTYSAKDVPVYMYTFEFKGMYSMLELNEGNKFKYSGVSHGDELMYLFDMENAKLSEPYDERIKEQLNYLWKTFVKTGALPLTAESDYPVWQPYNSETKYYYKIDIPISKQSSYKQREIDFWLNHLPALSKIVPPTNISDVKAKIGGFGWAMFVIVIILLVLLIVVSVILYKKSRKQYFTTKTEDQ